MYQKLKLKINRGSILGATLIILGLMLVSALSFALVSIQERKASIGANTSSQALQTASTGVEKVMQLIKNNGDDTVASIDKDGTCDGVINNSAEGYAVQLQDDAGDIVPCASSVSAVKKVKSVGTIGGNQRAVEVAVAANTQMEFYFFGASGSDHGGGAQNKDCSWYPVKWNGVGSQLGEESFCSLAGKDLDPTGTNPSNLQAQTCAQYKGPVYQCIVWLRDGKWVYGAPIGNDTVGCFFVCFRFKK